MIRIHGGGFTQLDGQINPKFFMDEDVLVVSIQWVNRNIQYFGGDPGRVTLFGDSAGAISCHVHLLSPRTGNIFHGAILQSGSTLMRYSPFFIENDSQKQQKSQEDRL